MIDFAIIVDIILGAIWFLALTGVVQPKQEQTRHIPELQ